MGITFVLNILLFFDEVAFTYKVDDDHNFLPIYKSKHGHMESYLIRLIAYFNNMLV